MVHQERLEIGEKSFVSAVMAVLATEAGLTVVTNGMHFSWVGLLLGVTGFCLILFLANRLYAGSRQAYKIALTWIGFQVVCAAFVLGLMVSSVQGAETARQIGAPAAWPVLLKLLVYLTLGWVLVRMPTVRDFFADKRGDFHAPDLLADKKTAVAQEPDAPLAFTADHNQAVRRLAQYIRLAVAALIALGILQMVSSFVVFRPASADPQGLLVLVQGVLTVVLGAALGAPSNEIRPLTVPEEQTKGRLLRAFGSLLKFYRVQILIGLLLAAVTAARFVIAFLAKWNVP